MAARFQKLNWEDYPSKKTPINATNLNRIEDGIANIYDYANDQITSQVTTWLNGHVDPVGSAVTVDTSLSISGSAADSKATGDAINARPILASIAPVFNENTDYPANYMVINPDDKFVYRLTEAHTAGTAWEDTAKVATYLALALYNTRASKANSSALAPVFDPDAYYPMNSLVCDNDLGNVYRLSEEHEPGTSWANTPKVITTMYTRVNYLVNDSVVHSSIYRDPTESAFSRDALKCAVSYLVHQVNNTQVTGVPNDNLQRFYALYLGAPYSWRGLLAKEYCFKYNVRRYKNYNGHVYPVYGSHCTPFVTSITSCVPYGDSPWEYLFSHQNGLLVERLWSLSQEKGSYSAKPYTYSMPSQYHAGPENYYILTKNGLGHLVLASKSNDTWRWQANNIGVLKTGDWIHVRRNNNDNYAGHGHSAVYVKTIEEIQAAVETFGCELVSWSGKDDFSGQYGYVIEVTNNDSNGDDAIRVTDLEAMANRYSANTSIVATISRANSFTSTKTYRMSNYLGSFYFIHQPYTGLCVNGEPLFLAVLTSKEEAKYQWQYSDDGTTWNNITDATDSTYENANPVANRLYRCEATDKTNYLKIYSEPVTCYKVNVSNPTAPPESGTYTCTISVTGDSADLCTEKRWYFSRNLNQGFGITNATTTETLSVDVDETRNGWLYCFRITMPDGSYYWTKTVTFEYSGY